MYSGLWFILILGLLFGLVDGRGCYPVKKWVLFWESVVCVLCRLRVFLCYKRVVGGGVFCKLMMLMGWDS